MNFVRVAVTLLAVAFLAGCGKVTYTAPIHSNNMKNYSVTIDKPFEDVWKSLIQYSASTFFAIDNYEKDSGLITLDFGSSNPSHYVTGGHFTVSAPGASFDGDYVQFFEMYRGGKLDGRMNIVVLPEGDDKTTVTVNARYIFKIPPKQQVPGQTWTFDSGSCSTVFVPMPAAGTPPTRTICPTYKAEQAIMDALK